MNGLFEQWSALIASARTQPDSSPGVYVHVPYCSTRCGYCDFNTYTPSEIDVAASEYAKIAVAEIGLAGRYWQPGGIDTVFIGGGTPTLLAPDDIGAIIAALDSTFTLNEDAEITIEANPDSVTGESLKQLRTAGVTRVSFGVQSLAEHVLATLDRTHTPGRALTAIAQAHEVGFEHVSADLMYATPGETDDDFAASVRAVLDAGVDHLSAYSLIVEPGTRLAQQVRRGDIPAPDDDIAAGRYAIVDTLARDYGLQWYEVSNWAKPGGQCRHNVNYWREGDWWAIGPGAHGHLGGDPGIRWWNSKHPRAHADAVQAGLVPIAGWESIDESTRRLETLMLGLRLSEGIASSLIPVGAQASLADYLARGLLIAEGDRVRLSDPGRLLADAIVREFAAAIESE